MNTSKGIKMANSGVHLPPEWTDDQKMSVLFAPFRERSLNPHSWERKLKFWTTAICEDCKSSSRFIIDLKELQGRFMRQGSKPGCLDVVLKEMTRNTKLQKLSVCQQAGSNSWFGWGFRTFVWTPISWGVSTVWKKEENPDEPYVVMEILKGKCSELLERHYSSVEHESTDNVMELSMLRTQYASLCRNQQEFDLVLHQLQLDKKIIISQTLEKDTVIKFCKKGDKKISPMTDLEINIFRIQKVVKNLEAQTEILSKQCDKLTQEATTHVKAGKKTLALQSLRRRKRVERTLTQKLSSVDQLHDMMSKIQDAATNDMILKAYESGMNAIKTMNQDTSVDKVESVIDDLTSALEDQGEVTMLLSQDLSPNTSRDDLEKELSDLMLADQRAAEEDSNNLTDLLEGLSVKSPMPKLPDVPNFSPSKEGIASRDTTISRDLTPSKAASATS